MRTVTAVASTCRAMALAHYGANVYNLDTVMQAYRQLNRSETAMSANVGAAACGEVVSALAD